MTPERFAELNANGGTLTPAEQALGWHFCHEFDGLLTMGEGPGPCPCGIHGDSPLQLTRDPEPHGTRDTFVPPPVKCDDDFIIEFDKALDLLTEESITATNNTIMPPARWLQLTMNGGHITPLERVEGWHYCPRLDDKLTKIQNNICKLCGADQGPDPLSLVVYDPNEPVPHLTDEEIEAHLSDTTVSTKPPIVHQHNDQWYFWEETYSQRIGPYSTEIAANKALDHYCDVVLGQGRDPS